MPSEDGKLIDGSILPKLLLQALSKFSEIHSEHELGLIFSKWNFA